MRALSVAVEPVDQGRAWKHDTDLTDCLTDLGVSLLGHVVLTASGRENAGKLRSCGEVYSEEFWSQVDARVGQLGPVRLRRDYAGIRGAQGRVMAGPAASYGVVAAGGPGGEG